MGRIKRCDIVTINNNFQLSDFATYEDVDFEKDREYLVTGVDDGGVRIEDSPYWYPEGMFDLAPLKKGDMAYHESYGELKVVGQEGQIVTLKDGDKTIFRIPRSELYKLKSISKYYFNNNTKIYINNIFFKLDIRKKF